MADTLLLDDHSLISEILTGSVSANQPDCSLITTSLWLFRAGRAAVLGAGGQLSGPFEQLDPERQEVAIATLLDLPDHVALLEARTTVPAMVRMAGRHERLNLLNLEALTVAHLSRAHVLIAERAAAGILPAALAAESITWEVWDSRT